MNGKKAKVLRGKARGLTVGYQQKSYGDFDFTGYHFGSTPTCRLNEFCTRRVYQQLKRAAQ